MTTHSQPSLLSFPLGLIAVWLLIFSLTRNNVGHALELRLFPTMPPWRGVRQVLEIGPWGKVVDKVSFKATKLLLKSTNTSQVLFVDSNDGSTRLLDKSDLPSKPSPHHLRIVAASDTHGKHRFLPIPKDCDVFVHCGDLLQRW